MKKTLNLLIIVIVIFLLYAIGIKGYQGYNLYMDIKKNQKTLEKEVNSIELYNRLVSLQEEYIKYTGEIKKYFYSEPILFSLYSNLKKHGKTLGVNVTSVTLARNIRVGKNGEKMFSIDVECQGKPDKLIDFVENLIKGEYFPVLDFDNLTIKGNTLRILLKGFISTDRKNVVITKDSFSDKYVVGEVYAEVVDPAFKAPNKNFILMKYQDKVYLCKVIVRNVDKGTAELIKNKASLEGKIYLLGKEED